MVDVAIVDIPSNVAPYRFVVGSLGDVSLTTREELRLRHELDEQMDPDDEENEGGSIEFQVTRFSLREAFCEPGQLELQVMSGTPDEIPLSMILGKPAVFTWACGTELDRSFRYYHGIVTQFIETGATEGASHYTVVVVPRLWRTGITRRCRIFQNKTVPEIITSVLSDTGLNQGEDVKMILSGTYEPRVYSVQYRESDLSYITRLMEEEGLYYWLDSSEGRDVVMLADAPSAHVPSIPYRAVVVQRGPEARDDEDRMEEDLPLEDVDSEGHTLEERIQSFQLSHSLVPGNVHLRDYDFTNSANIPSGQEVGKNVGEPEVYDYPGGFTSQSRGRDLARVRMQELDARTQIGVGRSDYRSLALGRTFQILDHPRLRYNRGYICSSLTHYGAQHAQIDSEGRPLGMGGSSYENEFTCIPDDVLFRPVRVTPKPIVHGVQTARVVGPAGEEIYTDEFLRIKVQFHWDREGKSDEKSSCWLRVAQTWADGNFGSVYIPRIGQEVLVEFLEGDPDRPIVNGCVYNDLHMPPFSLPDKKMQTGVRSNTTPGGGGSNEIRLDDTSGGEEVFIHAQKDQNNVVENDETTQVGNDRSENVGHDETITIGNDRKKTIGGNETIKVEKKRDTTILIDDNLNIKGHHTVAVGDGHETITIHTGNRTRSVNTGHDTLNVKTGNHTINVNAGHETLNVKAGNHTMNVNAGHSTLNVQSGNRDVNVPAGTYQLVADKVSVIGNSGITISTPAKIELSAAQEITIGVGTSSITIKPDGIQVSAAKISSTAIGTHDISGALIRIN